MESARIFFLGEQSPGSRAAPPADFIRRRRSIMWLFSESLIVLFAGKCGRPRGLPHPDCQQLLIRSAYASRGHTQFGWRPPLVTPTCSHPSAQIVCSDIDLRDSVEMVESGGIEGGAATRRGGRRTGGVREGVQHVSATLTAARFASCSDNRAHSRVFRPVRTSADTVYALSRRSPSVPCGPCNGTLQRSCEPVLGCSCRRWKMSC